MSRSDSLSDKPNSMEKEFRDMKFSQLEMIEMMKKMESQLLQIHQSVHYIQDRFSELEVKMQDKTESSQLIIEASEKGDRDSKISPKNHIPEEKENDEINTQSGKKPPLVSFKVTDIENMNDSIDSLSNFSQLSNFEALEEKIDLNETYENIDKENTLGQSSIGIKLISCQSLIEHRNSIILSIRSR